MTARWSRERSAVVNVLGPPAGLRAVLSDQRSPARGGLVDWTATWTLSWEPVPGADGYLVEYGTAEGDTDDRRALDEPRLALTVAAGTDPASAVDDRRDQLAGLSAAQLRVRVAVRRADGSPGPASGWFAVGAPTA